MSGRIYVLPGMGADERMYPDAWRRLPNAYFARWPQSEGVASVEELARIMIERDHIAPGTRLVGSSLGGMVACEIADLIGAEDVFLVGSAVRADEINPALRGLAPASGLVPFELTRRLATLFPVDLATMFAESSAEFLHAMCRAVVVWPGYRGGAKRLWRIHGRRDPIILPPTEADLWLDAGHLVAMSHTDECARFVAKTIVGAAPDPRCESKRRRLPERT